MGRWLAFHENSVPTFVRCLLVVSTTPNLLLWKLVTSFSLVNQGHRELEIRLCSDNQQPMVMQLYLLLTQIFC